jgi:cellobiose phosphorylase
MNNIYLRIYKNDSVSSYPLLGIKSNSRLFRSEHKLKFEGIVEGICYEVVFRPIKQAWFWDVTIKGNSETVDLVYGQDLGLGPVQSVYANEFYISQYLGHEVFHSENGYVICSRQNMPAGENFPYLQQGILGAKAEHYSTDALQFFGLEYKTTDFPAALSGNLPDRTLQYECAFTALQTEKMILKNEKRLSFYALYKKNHSQAVHGIEYRDELYQAYSNNFAEEFLECPVYKLKEGFGKPYVSPSFGKEEMDFYFPDRKLEEYQESILLSFFTPEHSHVVTKEKEQKTQRPHGTIIMTPPQSGVIASSLISTTQYMYGIFNSHVVVGNTDMHKFISTPRGFLNILKNSGQRIYVKLGGKFRMLSLPAVFEMGMNFSKWFYKLDDDILTVTVYTTTKSPEIVMEVSSRKCIKYDFIITNQLSMGTNEYVQDVAAEPIADGLRFFLDTKLYPGLHYDIVIPNTTFKTGNDSIFLKDGTTFDETFLTFSLSGISEFKVLIRASLENESNIKTEANYKFEYEAQKARECYASLINHFNIRGKNNLKQIDILNETAWWYAHNAMIHFCMPHGLEQPGGAAWGTRDVCQGPMEFFLATGNFSIARQIIINVFSHQNVDTKEWPQWFMFDKYGMNAGECHGDVIFWPLKSVADYILASGDESILHETMPYDNLTEYFTLLEHIETALKNIENSRFIGDTGLITYAGGDWDDTLQPLYESLKEKLVSSWTMALAYQTFSLLAQVLKKEKPILAQKLLKWTQKIKNAFENVLVKDNVIAGFVEYDKGYAYMLHPIDNKTGMHYRLLPMTRSIISELADKKQAIINREIIHKNLKHPDGVRLMDFPAKYKGGVSRMFKRAEQAANVGREISLQYTHAHIRYIEAMAKLGYAEDAWNSLFTVNPILIQENVPNAAIRQSNMYFSSSDGAYDNRYDYQENFKLLKKGLIEVKGGWRLYSSGPGIYLRQVISNVFGLRFCSEGLIIDPVLPQNLDGISFSFDCFGKPMNFIYNHKDIENVIAFCNGEILPSIQIENPYRQGGICISLNVLMSCENEILIHIPFKKQI